MLEVIDLTRVIDETTFVLAESTGYTDPPIRFEAWTTIEEKGYSVTALHMGVHAGTHCDVSSHYVQGGRTITDFSPASFAGWAVVLDMQGKGPIDSDAVATCSEMIERDHDAILILRNTVAEPFTADGRQAVAACRPKLIVTGGGWNVDENYYDSDFFHRCDVPLIMNPNFDALATVRDGDFIAAFPLALRNLEASPVRLVAIRGLIRQ